MSALSVEPRGVAALPEGFPEDASHGSNVRAGLSAHASRAAEDLAQPPHEAELLDRPEDRAASARRGAARSLSGREATWRALLAIPRRLLTTVRTLRWRPTPTLPSARRPTRPIVRRATNLCARTSSATRWLSDSSTSSTSQRRTSSRTYLPRRRQLRCCGCSRRSWTALPESLCWLACTSNFFVHITTYASSRNTLSSKSTLDRLHTLHTQRCATHGRGGGIPHPYLHQYR